MKIIGAIQSRMNTKTIRLSSIKVVIPPDDVWNLPYNPMTKVRLWNLEKESALDMVSYHVFL